MEGVRIKERYLLLKLKMLRDVDIVKRYIIWYVYKENVCVN